MVYLYPARMFWKKEIVHQEEPQKAQSIIPTAIKQVGKWATGALLTLGVLAQPAGDAKEELHGQTATPASAVTQEIYYNNKTARPDGNEMKLQAKITPDGTAVFDVRAMDNKGSVAGNYRRDAATLRQQGRLKLRVQDVVGKMHDLRIPSNGLLQLSPGDPVYDQVVQGHRLIAKQVKVAVIEKDVHVLAQVRQGTTLQAVPQSVIPYTAPKPSSEKTPVQDNLPLQLGLGGASAFFLGLAAYSHSKYRKIIHAQNASLADLPLLEEEEVKEKEAPREFLHRAESLQRELLKAQEAHKAAHHEANQKYCARRLEHAKEQLRSYLQPMLPTDLFSLRNLQEQIATKYLTTRGYTSMHTSGQTYERLKQALANEGISVPTEGHFMAHSSLLQYLEHPEDGDFAGLLTALEHEKKLPVLDVRATLSALSLHEAQPTRQPSLAVA